MHNNTRNVPVAPLPNPGEGGPVYNGATNPPSAPNGGDTSTTPVIPLPNPGEGGPVDSGSSDGSQPVIPLPNPGEGGPVNSGGTVVIRPLPGQRPGIIPVFPRSATVRYLNAAYGYSPFRIYINNLQVVSFLSSASVTSYRRIGTGYQRVTVAGPDGYVYVQKSIPFEASTISTLAIINSASGLDVIQIPDICCTPGGNTANFRVSNLSYSSAPIDVLLADGRVVYSDVQFKETTSYKRIQPGAYEFLFAETSRAAMPSYLDIETLDSAFIGMDPLGNTITTLYLDVRRNTNYTVFLIQNGPTADMIHTLVISDQ